MAFESKAITPDVLKQMLNGLIGDRLGWRRRMAPTKWIVDDHTGNFLYPTYWGDEENRNSSAYVFSWRGELIGIAVERAEQLPDGAKKPPKVELTIQQFALPDRVEVFRTDIEGEITAALRCRHAYAQEIEVRFESREQATQRETAASQIGRNMSINCVNSRETHSINEREPRVKDSDKSLLLWLGVFVATLITLGVASTLPRALEGVPAYDALDLTEGTLTNVGVCNRRGAIPIWVKPSAGAPQQVWLPCAPGIAQIAQRLGAHIEVRSHAVSPRFLNPVPDIWSVVLDDRELYSYKDRAARTSPLGLYVWPLAWVVGLGSLYGYFVWAVHFDLSRQRAAGRAASKPPLRVE